MDPSGVIRKTCKRYNERWNAHELTFSCLGRRPFLTSERTRAMFAQAVARARRTHCFDVWAYVVMPEHVHLLIWPRLEPYSISAILKSIKQSVARRAIAYLRQFNPSGLARLATGQRDQPHRFWLDGGGHDRNIWSKKYLLNAMTYMHNNPVKRGLVERAGDWVWSSFRDWEKISAGPIPIDKESFLEALC